MKKKITVFYSWQSDIFENKNLIASCLDKALREIKADGKNGLDDFSVEINVDRDTKNTSGTPAISQTIFNKISESDIFICDVTLINNSWYNRALKNRATPNPNVLIELGFAINYLGWERIICLNNIKHGENELLPFDLRSHRIGTFSVNGEGEKKDLVLLLKSAIKSIIKDYEGISERHKYSDFKIEDKSIFNKIQELASEVIIRDTVETIANNLFYNGLHIYRLKSLPNFYDNSINHFINKNVDEKFRILINLIESFTSLCFKHIVVENHSPGKLMRDVRIEGDEISDEEMHDILQNERYFYPKEPYDDDWGSYHQKHHRDQQEIGNMATDIQTAYRDFITVYRKEILV